MQREDEEESAGLAEGGGQGPRPKFRLCAPRRQQQDPGGFDATDEVGLGGVGKRW